MKRFERKVQLEAVDMAADLARRKVDRRRTFLVATPGGGKTATAVLFWDTLERAAVVDFVIWLVPNDALRVQVAEGFREVMAARGRPELYLEVARHVAPPYRRPGDKNCRGYVTTYHAMNAVIDGLQAVLAHLEELQASGQSVLVVFDEAAHLADPTTVVGEQSPRPWATIAEPLERAAYHTLLMTGTPERTDQAQVPFVPYNQGLPEIHLRYTFSDALADRAVIPFQFHAYSGWVKFRQASGATYSIDSSEVSGPNAARKLVSGFMRHEGYWKKLLHEAVEHWRAHRTITGYESRLLVICSGQARAEKVTKLLREVYSIDALCAVSKLGQDGRDNLNAFSGRGGKRKEGDALVTCAMAHEGFDAPDLSHVVYLAAVRAKPWATQAIHRGNRVDYAAARAGLPWEKQTCFVFVPDDPLMQEIVRAIEADQLEGLERREEPEAREGPGRGRSGVVSVDANLTMACDPQLVRGHGAAPRLPELPSSRVSVPDEASDKIVRAEVQRLARRRDELVGQGRTQKDLALVFGVNWSASGGEPLLRVRDYLARVVGASGRVVS